MEPKPAQAASRFFSLPRWGAIVALLPGLVLVACSGRAGDKPTPAATTPFTPAPTVSPETLAQARDKIKHVVIIMQENRSFDSYFGTYPGADGIPMANGVPTVCLPDDTTGQCVAPYHDTSLLNAGGPHSFADTAADVDGGKMDGFVNEQRTGCVGAPNPNCGKVITVPDVMGYHNASEIPNYWTYAQQFVLQDRMFSSAGTWSQPVHLFMVSAWSAKCSTQDDPSSCVNEPESPDAPPDLQTSQRAASDGSVPRPNFAWTDVTYLLRKNNVSWAYYVAEGTQMEVRGGGPALRSVASEYGHAGNLEPVALVHHRQPEQPVEQHSNAVALHKRGTKWDSAGGLMGGAGRAQQ